LFLVYIAVNVGQGKVHLTDNIEIAEADELSDNNVALPLLLNKEGSVHSLQNAVSALEKPLRAAMPAKPVAAVAAVPAVVAAVPAKPVAALVERKLGSPKKKRKPYPLVWAEVYSQPGCKGDKAKVPLHQAEAQCDNCWDACNKNFESKNKVSGHLLSVRVFVKAVPDSDTEMPKGWGLEINSLCAGSYAYSEADIAKHTSRKGIRAEHGCVDTGDAYTNLLTWTGLPDEEQDFDPQSYRFMYSTESSTYFAYQTYANLLSFEKSGQQKEPPTGYVRLLTAPEPDDIALGTNGQHKVETVLYSLCTHYALTMHSLHTHYTLTTHSLHTHYTLTTTYLLVRWRPSRQVGIHTHGSTHRTTRRTLS
jgi:hypothetical protein